MKILALNGKLIEDLYVPQEMQDMGYGRKPLQFAISLYKGMPVLWIAENKVGAGKLYRQMGFRKTGKRKTLINRADEAELHLTRLFAQVTG